MKVTLICLRQHKSWTVLPNLHYLQVITLTYYLLNSMFYHGCSGPRGLANWVALSRLLHMVAMPLSPVLFLSMATISPLLHTLPAWSFSVLLPPPPGPKTENPKPAMSVLPSYWLLAFLLKERVYHWHCTPKANCFVIIAL
jgi:hypothetical protein